MTQTPVMNRLPGPRAPAIDALLRATIAEMASRFEVDAADAEDAIATGLGDVDLTSQRMHAVLGEHTPDYWAQVFHHGSGTMWWGPSEMLLDPRTAEAEAHLRSVIAEMVRLFGIDEEEAAGRVARAWAKVDLTDDDGNALFGHELPDYWAKNIYYPSGTLWWTVPAEDLQPRPWP
jgi:hypothetical protein